MVTRNKFLLKLLKYYINSTADYHQHDLNSLGWELTVCNSLEPVNSPCRKILTLPLSFGEHLYNFLKEIIPFNNLRSILRMRRRHGLPDA